MPKSPYRKILAAVVIALTFAVGWWASGATMAIAIGVAAAIAVFAEERSGNTACDRLWRRLTS